MYQQKIESYLNTPIFKGSRNGALFVAAAACKDLGYSQTQAEQTLLAKAQGDGLPYGEIMQTIRSAFDRPISEYTPNNNGIGQNLDWNYNQFANGKKPEQRQEKTMSAPIEKKEIKTFTLPEPSTNWKEDFKQLLFDAFKPGEKVSIVKDVMLSGGKYIPASKGSTMSVGSLLERSAEDFHNWIGHNNGAYMRINPMDGEGVKDANVTAFRHVLVESDTLSLEQQYSTYKSLELPVSALIHSGSKSLHAWVRVDAENLEQYKERRQYVYDVLEQHGFEIDQANKNPSRLSRLPGVNRGDGKQYLIEGKSGKANFEEWKEFIENDEIDLDEIFDQEIVLEKEVIHGVLRKGHTLSITGPSKAGKSFAIINLGLSMAAGRPWFGHNTEKSKVLYFDIELTKPSFKNRIKIIADKLKINKAEIKGNFIPIPFKGKQSANILIDFENKIKKHKPDVILIDPIYKVLQGADENDNTAMTNFCNNLDIIGEKHGCSIVFVHHHRKGDLTAARGLDRQSGAGVFGRHPSANIDLTQHREGSELVPNVYKIEYTLREFPAPSQNFGLIEFDYPIHTPKIKDKTNDELIEILKVGHTTWNNTIKSHELSHAKQVELLSALRQHGYELCSNKDIFEGIEK